MLSLSTTQPVMPARRMAFQSTQERLVARMCGCKSCGRLITLASAETPPKLTLWWSCWRQESMSE